LSKFLVEVPVILNVPAVAPGGGRRVLIRVKKGWTSARARTSSCTRPGFVYAAERSVALAVPPAMNV